MADYKVIYRADNKDEISIPWEPGCPVQVEAIQVSRDRITARTFLQLRVRNVSGEKILSFSSRVLVIGADGEESADLQFLDADIPEAGSFDIPPRELTVHEVSSVACLVSEAKTPQLEWAGDGARAEIPSRKKLSLSGTAADERSLQVHEMSPSLDVNRLSYEAYEGDEWWICSCGHVNVRRERCWSCGADLSSIKKLQDEAFLLASAKQRGERKAAAAEEEAKARAERSGKVRKRLAIAGAVIAIALIAGYLGARPAANWAANWAIRAGNYEFAKTLYSMIGIGGSGHQLEELLSGTVKLNDADYECLKAAADEGALSKENISSLAERRLENDGEDVRGYADAVALLEMIGDEEGADKVRYEYVTEVRSKNMLTEEEYKETLRAHGYPGAEDL